MTWRRKRATYSAMDAVIKFIKLHIPKFKLDFKNKSWKLRFIGLLLRPFNSKFMTEYITTLKWTVYFPNEEYLEKYPKTSELILLHEFVHLWDRKHQGALFSFLYLCPQILAVIPMVALLIAGWFMPWWVNIGLGILTGVLLLPFPSPWRMRAELRGYTMNLAYAHWTWDSQLNCNDNFVVRQFTGWGYYKMWGDRKDMEKRFIEVRKNIMEDKLDEPFLLAKKFVQDAKTLTAREEK